MAITPVAGGNTRLQLARPLLWTHLGVVLDVPEDELNRKVSHGTSW